MIKYLLVGSVFLCLFNIAAHAGPVTGKTKIHKDGMGLGLGAIIGGLIAGPPGAIIGAAGGAWYGDKQDKKDEKLAALEQRLSDKQAELAGVQSEFSDMEARRGMEMQQVNLQQHVSSLDKLSRGITLTVFFRTNSYSLEPENATRIEHLAQYLQDLPEIQLNLEAYADKRGTEEYNQHLSLQRADAVKQALIRGGLQAKRIHSLAYGESGATAIDGDLEGYIFDRRVQIQLSLDTDAYALNQN